MAKVLIVDDDHDICVLLSDLLAEEGFSVRSAHNGQEALEILQREPGWVVLLDLHMPLVDGREFLRQFQRNPRWQKRNRVVLMSASVPVKWPRLSLPAGLVQRILPKPFELDEVVGVVQKLAS